MKSEEEDHSRMATKGSSTDARTAGAERGEV